MKKWFFNIYKFSNHDGNTIGNHVHPYAYMDDWEKLNETSLHEKKDWYCNLNMEDITDANYTPAKRVFKDFEMNNLEEYHGFDVQSDKFFIGRCISEISKNVSWNIWT